MARSNIAFLCCVLCDGLRALIVAPLTAATFSSNTEAWFGLRYCSADTVHGLTVDLDCEQG